MFLPSLLSRFRSAVLKSDLNDIQRMSRMLVGLSMLTEIRGRVTLVTYARGGQKTHNVQHSTLFFNRHLIFKQSYAYIFYIISGP